MKMFDHSHKIHIMYTYILYIYICTVCISLVYFPANLPQKPSIQKPSIHVGKYTSHAWILWDWNHLGISSMAFGRKIHANFRGKLGTGKRQAAPIRKSMEIIWTCWLVVFLFPLDLQGFILFCTDAQLPHARNYRNCSSSAI